MLKNTLLNALEIYRIHIQNGNSLYTQTQINQILLRIESCEQYLIAGKEVTGAWLEENHSVLSKSVNCAHDLAEQNSDEAFGDITEEHKDLNKLILFYKEFYKQNGIVPEYMSINFN